jgi:tetratricopeptide (TPR) repeat protein
LLFDRLSVFAGSFSLGGAEAVCSGQGIQKKEALELLARLVDQSLVGRAEGPGGATRYRLLETLRAYGQERLAERGETEEMAAHHAGYYVSLVEATEPAFHAYGREMIDAQRQLDAEADNLASAVGWALARRQPEMAMRIGGALHLWAMYRPHYIQYAEWMRHALAQEGEVAPLYRAKAWALISGQAFNWGRYEEMGAAAQAGLASARAAGDPQWIASGLYFVAMHLREIGQHKEARIRFQECRSLARQCGDARLAFVAALSLAEYEPLGRRRILLEEILRQAPYAGRPYGLQFLAGAAQLQGDLKDAEAYLRESLAGWTEAGNVHMQGALSRRLGEIHALRGDYTGAARMVERGRALVRGGGNYAAVIRATRLLGHLAWRQGEFDTATSRYGEALELARRHGYTILAALARLGLALVAAERGEHERAEALCAEARRGLPEWPDEGQAFALSPRGRAVLLRGDGARAVALYRQALERARRDEPRPDMVEQIEYLAWALAADGQDREAARLLALAQREREEMSMVLPPVDRPHHERALETVQDGLGEAGLAAAWAEGEMLALEEAVEEALAGTRGTSDDATS